MMAADLLEHPNSPVDTASFPGIYHALPLFQDNNECGDHTKALKNVKVEPALHVDEYAVIYNDCELEPFEYVHTQDNAQQQQPLSTTTSNQVPYDTSSWLRDITDPLSVVFEDQALVDAIMGSLTSDPLRIATKTVGASPVAPIMAPSMPIMRMQRPQQALPLHQGPRPGTFLNKDGRWIKGKPCRMDKCDKRAQSSGLCKGHGGGARCSFQGCPKSSQGGGFCRAHGGGKRCMQDGCNKGTQRNGYCYLHGGVRSCSVQGCEKKDRGNGKCFSHGGGRTCHAEMCGLPTRRGMYCDMHIAQKPSSSSGR